MNTDYKKYLLMKKKYLIYKYKNILTGGGENIKYYFNKRLIYDKSNKKCTYYQDIRKKWKFYTDEEGFKLLYNLQTILKKLLNHNMNLIKNKNKNYQKIIDDGYKIYINKSSLKKNSNKYGSGEYVTWTDKEYNHLGLQRQYLVVKSFQRFTEIWSLLERSYNNGLFNNLPKNITITALGGGPGFECYTWKMFFNKYLPNIKCNFLVLDLEDTWAEYVKLWGKEFKFFKWDIYKDDFYKTTKVNKTDFVIISNVLVMYMTNEISYNLFESLLSNGTKGILINSRSKDIEAKKELLKKGIHTTNLISQDDDRQLIFSSLKNRELIISNGLTDSNKKNIFPNVPFIK